MLGILIALYINNWNNKRIGAENTKLLFKEVSDELVLNIDNIDRVLKYYLEKDPIYFKVLNKKVEPEDYRENDNLFTLLMEWERTTLVDDDFKALLAGKENLTEQQDSIFSELKDLYGKRKVIVDRNNQLMVDAHMNYRDKLVNEQPWYSSFTIVWSINDENFDEVTRYALTNPYYLNQMGEIRHIEGGHYHGMLFFRTKALNLYKRISEMLNIKKDTSLVKDIADFEHVRGVYGRGEVKREISGVNELKYKVFRNDSIIRGFDIHPYSKSYFIGFRQDSKDKDENWMFRTVYGGNGQVIGLIGIQNMREVDGKREILKKIE
ncbi:hypothetical protein [Muriicola marianensis]|uniref:hypothetical protein n=1 Tax=Muriicola marianensis TaxID=1324801 RepID=UPI0018888506|nr:hypothetical protein [Muriicola marianensis]